MLLFACFAHFSFVWPSAYNFHRIAKLSLWKVNVIIFPLELQILESNISISKPISDQCYLFYMAADLHRGLSQEANLKWLCIWRRNRHISEKSPGHGFMFLTLAHQVCLSGILPATMFYRVLTFLCDFISPASGGPNESYSTRTWGNDSSQPRAIPALGMLKVSGKIYNILLSNISTPTDVFSKTFLSDVSESKFVSCPGFLIVSLYRELNTAVSSLAYLCRHIDKLWIGWSFGSEHRRPARLWRKDYFCCDSNYNWFGGLCPTCSYMAFYKWMHYVKRTLSHTPFTHPCVFRSIRNRSSRAHAISPTLVYLTEVAVLKPGQLYCMKHAKAEGRNLTPKSPTERERGQKKTAGNIQATKNH